MAYDARPQSSVNCFMVKKVSPAYCAEKKWTPSFGGTHSLADVETTWVLNNTSAQEMRDEFKKDCVGGNPVGFFSSHGFRLWIMEMWVGEEETWGRSTKPTQNWTDLIMEAKIHGRCWTLWSDWAACTPFGAMFSASKTKGLHRWLHLFRPINYNFPKHNKCLVIYFLFPCPH